MDLLRGRTAEGEVLYAIAYEDWKNHKTGFAFMHAKDRGDACAKLLDTHRCGTFAPTTRIVDIAPAIGV